MTSDEQAIRDVVAEWHRATTEGDNETVLTLMTDDVLFLTAGRPPFGKEAFASTTEQRGDTKVEGNSEIEELVVAGEWAWMRSRIEVAMTPPGGEAQRRSGHTLTIFRKDADGRWRLARDANLLPPPG